MADIIKLEEIKKEYGTVVKTEVLHGINLAIEESSFISIVGQSGSGKSTLMNIIGTLDKPSSGEVTISGRKTNKMNKNELAKVRNETIGFIFQFHYLLPEFTAFENVILPYRIKGLKPTKEVVERARELMDIVEISMVRNNLAPNMSGGQQQRTAIARALINNPKIILADEPTGNLDSDTSSKVFNLMRSLNKKYGTTFVIITHDRRIAEETDRIIEIKDGNIVNDITR
ncbi:lipoprotein ABC transporter ATP-binding protein [Mesotoga sp. HF07.pep.5.2.highcov]|jgi:lipoprotein-releasing system ATP-binding protein|uniref:ABC transporter ATP-binding protein n=1 Tax=Mesotoga TaxID=1184396 RepID=UPI0002C99A98|nr:MULTISPECIES: ABC transporter ATP-binding protein [Mesotoga]CCU84473.1 Lipoprotein-releasing system ATP-binding protein LolD 1 [Mesotoga infera]RLL84682.1 lipoprotein ABC transporter ATP-binding protein [Mesotoga sp. H07pep.5.4]RLL92736.1 lipoprotein ABC transporter ATP-binding protein [Mesotoga sp. HF07.pep.5.2.highcov]HNQ71876.1 ABC transporter ATP-binding protein [Mesotoga prima]HNS76881.1 ABC transporter ATP-binding protein [Mesotoga prima]